MAENVTVMLVVSGGFDGGTSVSSVEADGTVLFDPSEFGDRCETTLPDGEAGVRRLLADLDEDGLFNEDDGCFDPRQEVMDGTASSIYVRRDGELRRFSSYSGAGPQDLLDAIDTVSGFFDEQEATCGDVYFPANDGSQCLFEPSSRDVAVEYTVRDYGTDERWTFLVFADGAVIQSRDPDAQRDDIEPVECTAALANGATEAAELLDDLEATGVLEAEQGCYSLRSYDASAVMLELFITSAGETFLFRSLSGAGPAAIQEAVAALEAHLASPRQSCE
jgi:hypothetical protein